MQPGIFASSVRKGLKNTEIAKSATPRAHKTTASSVQKMKNYFKRRGWKDLIFLLVVLAGSAWVEYRFYGIGQSDVAKWKRRAELDASHRASVPPGPGQVGLLPCFFIADKQARMIEVEITDPQGRHMKIDARLSHDELRYSVESHVDIRH
jgi:hypothetical protein